MQRDKIAGFDFDKMVVIIRPENVQTYDGIPVYEQKTITNNEMEVIKDAWLDYLYKLYPYKMNQEK